MKINAMEDASGDTTMKSSLGTVLYDLKKDPYQMHPIQDKEKEAELQAAMITLMKENDAPGEQYERLGFNTLA